MPEIPNLTDLVFIWAVHAIILVFICLAYWHARGTDRKMAALIKLFIEHTKENGK